jgi:hypothetical protein
MALGFSGLITLLGTCGVSSFPQFFVDNGTQKYHELGGAVEILTHVAAVFFGKIYA